MVPINLRLDASIRGLLGLSLGTLIGRTDSPARGIVSKAQTQQASTGPLITRNTRRISITKAVNPLKGSQRRVRRFFGPSSSSSLDVVDAVAVGAQKRSQRGRMVALPQRFRE
jgi:hypothetical protein